MCLVCTRAPNREVSFVMCVVCAKALNTECFFYNVCKSIEQRTFLLCVWCVQNYWTQNISLKAYTSFAMHISLPHGFPANISIQQYILYCTDAISSELNFIILLYIELCFIWFWFVYFVVVVYLILFTSSSVHSLILPFMRFRAFKGYYRNIL